MQVVIVVDDCTVSLIVTVYNKTQQQGCRYGSQLKLIVPEDLRT